MLFQSHLLIKFTQSIILDFLRLQTFCKNNTIQQTQLSKLSHTTEGILYSVTQVN